MRHIVPPKLHALLKLRRGQAEGGGQAAGHGKVRRLAAASSPLFTAQQQQHAQYGAASHQTEERAARAGEDQQIQREHVANETTGRSPLTLAVNGLHGHGREKQDSGLGEGQPNNVDVGSAHKPVTAADDRDFAEIQAEEHIGNYGGAAPREKPPEPRPARTGERRHQRR